MITRIAVAGLILLSSASLLRAQDAATKPTHDPMPKDPSLPTLWIIGDSTVHQTGTTPDLFSWGDMIDAKFDISKINVVNRARGGRSSRTFITEGLWADVIKNAKAGDYLLMQFGHNDSSPLVDADRCRGSMPGTGDESKELDNNVTKKKEVVHTYGWYLKQMISEAKAKGMKVTVFSPVPRCPKGDHPTPSTEATGYQEWASDVAKEESVGYMDLHSVIWKTYAAMTSDQIKAKYFTSHDGTHSSKAGAELNMDSVIEGLKAMKDQPLVAYLK